MKRAVGVKCSGVIFRESCFPCYRKISELLLFIIKEYGVSKEFQVSILARESNQDVTVLQIASAAKNSMTQFYPRRIQISSVALSELNRKILEKLKLHQINAANISISLQCENDRTIVFDSIDSLQRHDINTDSLTKLISLKWSFVFDSDGDGQQHLHSIYVRISERPHPGLLLQKVLSGHGDDIDSLNGEAFAPIVCKVDFFDSRFSMEILAIISEWAKALPAAEPTFGVARWLIRYEENISSFVYGTLPALAVLGYIGVWLGVMRPEISDSVKYAASWTLGGGALFFFSRYISGVLIKTFGRQLEKIEGVPVFQITSGDKNKLTRYFAKSRKSMFNLLGAAILYGSFKTLGIYFSSYILREFFK